MASFQTSGFAFSSSCSCSCSSSKAITSAAISIPKLPRINLSVPKTRRLVQELNLLADSLPVEINDPNTKTSYQPIGSDNTVKATTKLYAILEAISDRIEMHNNIGDQRDNWNSLLLNSINMITLSAATMAGVAATTGAIGAPLLALKLSSTLLFSAATGMLVVMNKIQPSQLAEEQRNATRLFKQLYTQIQTTLALHVPTELDVKDAMDKVLALDEAYPLPLIGKMIEKFPEKFQPAVWWPKSSHERETKTNGWTKELELEMREIVQVLKRKDTEDYMRLGNLALKINKILAISGPLLTGIAAGASAFVGHGSWAAIVAVTAGALASTVNAFEHGGQIGMVIEMYRNCAGFFTLLEETIESTVDETDLEKRENGDIFEMNVALKLGRSLSQLRNLARRSSSSAMEGIALDEFASKLF